MDVRVYHDERGPEEDLEGSGTVEEELNTAKENTHQIQ